MQPQGRAHILTRACIALTLLLTTVNTASGRRPPPPTHGSGQTITLYTIGAAPPNAGGTPSSKHPAFTSQGPIGHPGSWLRTLTLPGALRPGTVTVIDEQFHGKREFGLPLAGKLQGVLVTSLDDNSSRMVAVKALFTGAGAEDSIRFFGVHRDGQEESHVAVVGGTGRYDGTTGFAVIRAADVPETSGNVSFSRILSFSVHLK
ncbi:hypothetical protein CFC21_042834 [Triticum aestivum]|uniref:Dirigent protein n=3 Tax=Triticum TaxID=4564 RepID=A0A9R1FNH3_WHEAT|nr:hypothetical protein CFC21_042832 [Triticum aestivum]KAF7031515.1 hypothetical protein CFC21_042834 [Triticum aestivum]CDM84876.1 unnamed protein product [Triticum aestivum]VAH81580.1 unnamed protein product [Triticum turgidum subsp. durum]